MADGSGIKAGLIALTLSVILGGVIIALIMHRRKPVNKDETAGDPVGVPPAGGGSGAQGTGGGGSGAQGTGGGGGSSVVGGGDAVVGGGDAVVVPPPPESSPRPPCGSRAVNTWTTVGGLSQYNCAMVGTCLDPRDNAATWYPDEADQDATPDITNPRQIDGDAMNLAAIANLPVGATGIRAEQPPEMSDDLSGWYDCNQHTCTANLDYFVFNNAETCSCPTGKLVHRLGSGAEFKMKCRLPD